MKKKIAIMCIMGAVMVGMTACGNKTTEDSETETETQTAGDTEAAADSSEYFDDTDWVNTHDDFVNIEDMDIDQYVTLADYKNMSVSAVKPEADDDSIESYINNYLLVGEVTDRAVKSGDTVNIDYEGKLDGEAFSGGTAQGYNLVIGSGSFIDGFEDGLIGVMPGETVDLTLTFPEDYAATDLAGKETVFTVTVNYIIATAEYSTVTVDDMKSMGLEYASLEELWEAGKSAIESQAEETFKDNAKTAINDKLMEESSFTSVPDLLVQEQLQYYEAYLNQVSYYNYGCDFETYVNENLDYEYQDIIDEMTGECEEVVKNFLVLEAVARAEGIELSADEVNKKAEEEYADYGYDSADDLLYYVGYTTYRMSFLEDMVMDKLVDVVTVTPETATE
jgi:trigger factor